MYEKKETKEKPRIIQNHTEKKKRIDMFPPPFRDFRAFRG